jgi:regulator of cell morphogenesis and NO signaling
VAVTKEMKIHEVTKKYPKTISVFGNFKIDFCCGGARSIEESAKSKGIDLEKLLAELNKAANENE